MSDPVLALLGVAAAAFAVYRAQRADVGATLNVIAAGAAGVFTLAVGLWLAIAHGWGWNPPAWWEWLLCYAVALAIMEGTFAVTKDWFKKKTEDAQEQLDKHPQALIHARAAGKAEGDTAGRAARQGEINGLQTVFENAERAARRCEEARNEDKLAFDGLVVQRTAHVSFRREVGVLLSNSQGCVQDVDWPKAIDKLINEHDEAIKKTQPRLP